MKGTQRWGCLLLCIQAATMAGMYGRIVFPISVSVVALSSLLSDKRLRLSATARFRVTAGVGILFLLRYLLAAPEIPVAMLAIRSELAMVAAEFLMVLQSASLFMHRASGRPSPWLAMSAATTMFCLGDVSVSARLSATYQRMALCFIAVAAGFGSSYRTMDSNGGRSFAMLRLIAVAIITGALLSASWAGAQALARHERDLEDLLSAFFRNQTRNATGFSGQGQLDSVSRTRTENDDEIALQVYSDSGPPPTYWRGQIFETFRLRAWNPPESRLISPNFRVMSDLPQVPPGQRVYALSPRFTPGLKKYECRPFGQSELRCFAPLKTQLVSVAADQLTIHGDGVAYKRSQGAPQSYSVYVGGSADIAPGIEQRSEALLQVPGFEDPGVRLLAESLFVDCRNTQDKLDAVQRYFRENHEYSLETQIPDGADPLSHFLLKRPPAHCEFFASGAAILLRMANVPCRYVTGFLVADHHPYGNCWVARNRHAHAWVEAFNAETGTWQIVDATPGAGVPTSTKLSWWRVCREYVSAWFESIRSRIQSADSLAATLGGQALGAMVVGLLLAVGIWILWKQAPRRNKSNRANREIHEYQGLLHRMEARLRRRFAIVRSPSESLTRFAGRLNDSENPHLRRASKWLTRYTWYRFQSEFSGSGIGELKKQLEDVWDDKNSRRR